MPPLKTILQNMWHIAQISPVFKNEPIPLVSFRRPSNIKDMLVRARVPTVENPKKPQSDIRTFMDISTNTISKVEHCEYRKCKICEHSTIGKTEFKSETTGKVYPLRDRINCKDTNIIYLISCDKYGCSKYQYVGETKNSMRKRGANHLSSVRCKYPYPVALHFNRPGHTIDNLKITPIEKIKTPLENPRSENIRKQRELYWIYELQTIFPNGLNKLDSML